MALSNEASGAKSTIPSPLDELDEFELYRMLGEAWYAQFRPQLGSCYFLAPSAEVGRREYNALLPKLRESLARPRRLTVLGCVTSTIQQSEKWRMPATVVATLAIKQGLAPAENLEVKHALTGLTAGEGLVG